MATVEVHVTVVVTMDTVTGKVSEVRLSSDEYAPMDDFWLPESEEWVSAGDFEPESEDAPEGHELFGAACDAVGAAIDAVHARISGINDIEKLAHAALLFQGATQAAQMVARWEADGPIDQQEFLDAAECLDEEGTLWKFPDGSKLRVTHDGDHVEEVAPEGRQS